MRFQVGLDCSFSGLSEQRRELGEDLLDALIAHQSNLQ